jgi:serine/threonine protein kinase
VTNPSKEPLIRAYTQQEVQLMGSLSHPNIVRFEEAFERPDQSWVIVMEYCEGGDLFGQLSRLCDAE